MRKGLVLTVIFIGGFTVAAGVQAEEQSGFYLGASVGEATNKSGAFEGNDIAFKVSGGYAFNRYFGMEVAYVDAGTQKDTVDLVRIENESSGVIASAVLNLPLSESFAVVGRIGYAFYSSDASSRLGNLSVRESDNDEDLAYGIGIQLAVWGGLALRAEYEAVDVSNGDFRIVSAGAVYKF